VRYQVVAALCAAATIAYMCRHWSGVAEAEVSGDLSLSDAQLSDVMGSFFYTYALFQVPAGLFAQRFGGRTALLVVALLWSLATVLSGLALGYWTLLAAVLFAGAAQAGVFPACVVVVSRWLPISSRVLTCGALGTFMQVGGAVASALTGWLIEQEWSWREVVFLYSAPGVVWALAFYVWYRDHPSDHRRVNAAERALIEETSTEPAGSEQGEEEETPQRTPWGTILTSVSMWLVCGQQFFRAAGYAFYLTWFPRYLKETRDVTTAESGYLASLPILAFGVGSILGGAFSDWVFRRTGSLQLSRHGVATVCMIVSAALILLAYFATTLHPAMALITAGIFVAGFGGPAGYAITIDLGGKYAPAIFGVMNMSGGFGAALCPSAVTLFVDLTGGWDWLLLLFAGIFAAAALCWFVLIWTGGIFGPLPARKTES